MLGKTLFYVVSFVSAWTGLLLTFKGFVIPGVMLIGVGCSLFNIVHFANGDYEV